MTGWQAKRDGVAHQRAPERAGSLTLSGEGTLGHPFDQRPDSDSGSALSRVPDLPWPAMVSRGQVRRAKLEETL